MSQDLKSLLIQLKNGEIEAVEYGVPGQPLGFMSSHRIIFIPTAGGTQFGIKQVHMRGLGSGIYLGHDVEAVIKASEAQVAYYLKPHANEHIRKKLAEKGDRTKCEYFAVPKAA